MKKILGLFILIFLTGCSSSSKETTNQTQLNTYKPPLYLIFDDPLTNFADLSQEYQKKIPPGEREKAIAWYADYKKIPLEQAEKLLTDNGYFEEEFKPKSSDELKKICRQEKIPVGYGEECLKLKYNYCKSNFNMQLDGLLQFGQPDEEKVTDRFIAKDKLDGCMNYYILEKLDYLSINGE